MNNSGVMKTPQWITLTTDFGAQDWFVGTMKGVLASLAPQARVIDLNHGLPATDIQAGAFSLASSFRYFPSGTLHLAIVDPGVGTDRAPIAIRTAEYLFVGPDNGVLSLAAEQEKILEVRRIENPKWALEEVSKTFHGRDIFAPAAAHLLNGVPFSQAGPKVTSFQRLSWPQISECDQSVSGSVIYVDRYGNAITNIPNRAFVQESLAADVFVKSKRITRVHHCYQAVAPGKPVCVPGSGGYLEIAINQGNAAERLKLSVGSPITVKW
jgi:S-adenosyl-L-methionine hydrolase (adenosine-forming)